MRKYIIFSKYQDKFSAVRKRIPKIVFCKTSEREIQVFLARR